MTSPITPPEILAAGIAARILHDVSGAASGVAAGLDLIADPGQADSHDAALDLAMGSAKALLSLLEFHKVALGAAGDTVAGEILHRLASTQFEGRRPRLEWAAQLESFPALAAQATLILVQIAAGAVAAGGLVRASAVLGEGGLSIQVDGEGPRAGLQSETIEGLEGRDLTRGLTGRWALARYLNSLVTAIGGGLVVSIGDAGFSLAANLPVAREA